MPFVTVFAAWYQPRYSQKGWVATHLLIVRCLDPWPRHSEPFRIVPQFTFSCLISRKTALRAALLALCTLNTDYGVWGLQLHVPLTCRLWATCHGLLSMYYCALFSPPIAKQLDWGTSPGQLLLEETKHKLASMDSSRPRSHTVPVSPFFLWVWTLSSPLELIDLFCSEKRASHTKSYAGFFPGILECFHILRCLHRASKIISLSWAILLAPGRYTWRKLQALLQRFRLSKPGVMSWNLCLWQLSIRCWCIPPFERHWC